MRKTTRSAFTLVELIVVITILAILGTITFISLQGYSADARNSKRTSDINNMQSAISIKMAEGGWLMAFVGGTNENLLTNIALAGAVEHSGATLTATYDAGLPNYTALGVKAEEFQDPNGQDYRIGATTTAGGRFELAASIEGDNGPEALVKGTYDGRDITTGAIDSVSGNVVTLNPAATNMFKTGDVVTFSDATTGTVTRAARDGVTLTITPTTTLANTVTTIRLTVKETDGLLSDRDRKNTPLVNGTNATLPY